jgi:3-polyprenyl-4-hydroxybenzoate decarboxylase
MATDTAIDLKIFPKVLSHILERVHWETDFFIFANLSMDTLDYCGPETTVVAILLGW